MPEPKRELELKLVLTKKELDQLAASPRLAELQRRRTKKKLKSVYFDTPDHRLHDENISLRIRDDGRHRYLQTIKMETTIKDGISNPIEIEDAVDSAEPNLDRIDDGRVRKKLRNIVEGSVLVPAFETVVDRTAYRLRGRASLIELALDKGEVRAGEQKNDISEAELELVKGSPKDLLKTAQVLFGKCNVRLSSSSKAEHGYRLLLKTREVTKLEPVHAMTPLLKRREICGEAFAKILRSVRAQIEKNRTVVLETDEPEAVHQLRVGLTRLRSVQRALKPLIDSPLLRELEADARTISRAVGRLRDADVLIEDIYAPVAGVASERAGFEQLYQLLQEHRAAMQVEARQVLCEEDWSRLLLSLTVWPPMLERDMALQRPVKNYAKKVLQKRWRKVAKCGRALKSLEPTEKHTMRKALKKLRYMVEFLGPLHPQHHVELFIKRLKSMQDVFGYVNDVRTAENILATCRNRSDASLAAGYVLGYHGAKVPEIWNGVYDDWLRLKAANRFWK